MTIVDAAVYVGVPRWHAVVTYRLSAGPVDIEHDLVELDELHDLIERGPHWDAIIEIRVTRAEQGLTLTVEEAGRQ